MKNNIQKLNLYHSFIFFLVTNALTLIIFLERKIVISHTISLFLILTIGISHGALDHVKGKKLLDILKINNMYLFFIVYILIALFIIILWLLFPTTSLIIFLLIASYHFGKEDTDFLIVKNLFPNQLLFFFKGLLIILAPLQFHFEETIDIFKFLLVKNERFYIFLNFMESSKMIPVLFLFSAFSSIYLFVKNFNFISFTIFLDFFSILILNYYLSPILAFGDIIDEGCLFIIIVYNHCCYSSFSYYLIINPCYTIKLPYQLSCLLFFYFYKFAYFLASSIKPKV